MREPKHYVVIRMESEVLDGVRQLAPGYAVGIVLAPNQKEAVKKARARFGRGSYDARRYVSGHLFPVPDDATRRQILRDAEGGPVA